MNFSVKPLRIATSVGVIITFVSFIIGLILVIQHLIDPSGVAGWTSTIVTVLFLSGVQLFSIGIVGEYLGRLYISSSKLPTYVIRQKVNCNDSDENNSIIEVENKNED